MKNIFKRKDKQFAICFSAVMGVCLTMVTCIRDTKKASKFINDDMSIEEKIRKAWKCYIPSGLIATSTIMCIIYSDHVSMNEKISLLNALATVQNNYKNIRKNIDEVCDDETREELLKRNIRTKTTKKTFIERTEKKMFFEEYLGDFFTSTIDDVLKAEYLFNKQLAIVGYATVNDFYKYLGLNETEIGSKLGWSVYDNDCCTDSTNPWVDFTHDKMEDDSGLEYFYVGFSDQPDVIEIY